MRTSLPTLCLGLVRFIVAAQLLEQDADVISRDVLPLTVNVLHQAEMPTWYENLAVRSNGQLVVTRLVSLLLRLLPRLSIHVLTRRQDTPAVELFDPKGMLPPITIVNFTSVYKGCLGITETTQDIFYVVAVAPYDSNFVKTSGNTTIFRIDLATFDFDLNGTVTSNATVTKIVDIPDAGFLNGMTTLSDSAVFIADASNGWVYLLDVTTGVYTVIVNDPNMKYLPDAASKLGINGVKVRDGYLYWSNTGNPVFCRIPILENGQISGPSEIVANIPRVDDFVFRADGTAWMSQNQLQMEAVIVGDGYETVAGMNTSTLMAGVTAGAFGRSEATSQILYLTSKGRK